MALSKGLGRGLGVERAKYTHKLIRGKVLFKLAPSPHGTEKG